MVSEGRKAAGFHGSSFTGSQGQAFLLVWLGGQHFLKGQGGGGHTASPSPRLFTCSLTLRLPEWPRGPQQGGRAGATLHVARQNSRAPQGTAPT